MNITELSEATGVSTRNIKRYIHDRLLAPPDGRTRSARYTEAHRRDLLRIKALHSGGWTFDQIRAEMRPASDLDTFATSADESNGPLVEHRYKIGPGTYLVFTPSAPLRSVVEQRAMAGRIRALAVSEQVQP
jgi:DNA-binding transcriptional MerR regulator